MTVKVTVRCVSCKRTKIVEPGDIPKDDVPYCDYCFMPMATVRVVVKRPRQSKAQP